MIAAVEPQVVLVSLLGFVLLVRLNLIVLALPRNARHGRSTQKKDLAHADNSKKT